MISDNEALKAYEILKKYCKERSHCKDCAFLKNKNGWAWIDLPKMDNVNYEKIKEYLKTTDEYKISIYDGGKRCLLKGDEPQFWGDE